MPKALYFHTPFCHTKCSYCVYDSNLASKQHIDNYFEMKLISVVESASLISLLQDNYFEELYCGGGTPTIGSASQWRNILDRIPLTNVKMLCTECSPSTVTSDHVSLWKDFKFSWVSMGVQSLRETILTKNNRISRPVDELERVLFDMNDGGIITNIDLICGINRKDSSDVPDFLEEVKEAMLYLDPVSITIHVDINIEKKILREIYTDLMRGLSKLQGRYSCVNHDLVYSENDILLNSEFRFMRDHKDFLFRQTAAAPTKLVKNWITWFISGSGITLQTPEEESIVDLVGVEQAYAHFVKFRKKNNLPFF